MIHLKRFNEEIGNPKLLDFHKDYKKLFDYDEDDYEEGDEPSRVDLFSMIGDLCVQHDITQQEVRQVLDTFDCSFDVDGLLEATYDNWTDEIGSSDGKKDSIKDSSIKLAREILDAAKLDVDGIEESDPDFIPYISDMILKWYNENSN